MGIAGTAAIVTQDEVLIFSQALRPPGVLARVERVRFREFFAVDKYAFPSDLHSFPWQPDDPFDEIAPGILWIVKDHHIAALRRVKIVHKLVNDQILPIVQVGLHADSLNAEILDQSADREEDQHGQEHCLHDVAQDGLVSLLLIFYTLAVL